MNRLVTLLLLPVTAALLIGATNDDGKHRGQQDVYFGFLLGSFANVPGVAEPVPRLAGVAIDLSAPDATAGGRSAATCAMASTSPRDWRSGSAATCRPSRTQQRFR